MKDWRAVEGMPGVEYNPKSRMLCVSVPKVMGEKYAASGFTARLAFATIIVHDFHNRLPAVKVDHVLLSGVG